MTLITATQYFVGTTRAFVPGQAIASHAVTRAAYWLADGVQLALDAEVSAARAGADEVTAHLYRVEVANEGSIRNSFHRGLDTLVSDDGFVVVDEIPVIDWFPAGSGIIALERQRRQIEEARHLGDSDQLQIDAVAEVDTLDLTDAALTLSADHNPDPWFAVDDVAELTRSLFADRK